MERPKSAVEIFGSVRLAEENNMFHVPKYLADVFRAFARMVQEAEEGFVILDTAPTGHTLLLLDAAGAASGRFTGRGWRQ